MYYLIQDVHYSPIKFTKTIPEGWYWHFPTCVKERKNILYVIEWDDPKNGIDVHLIHPASDESIKNKSYKVYDTGKCQAKNIVKTSGECTVVFVVGWVYVFGDVYTLNFLSL